MSLRPQEYTHAHNLTTKRAEYIDAPSNCDKLTWEHLTETEKSAASLGVDPNSWRPISFMNTVHYDTLLKSNALDDSLAKQLEAYKAVASG